MVFFPVHDSIKDCGVQIDHLTLCRHTGCSVDNINFISTTLGTAGLTMLCVIATESKQCSGKIFKPLSAFQDMVTLDTPGYNNVYILTVIPFTELENYRYNLPSGWILWPLVAFGVISEYKRVRVCSVSSFKSSGPAADILVPNQAELAYHMSH